MKKNDVQIGRYYWAKVSGGLTIVKIMGCDCLYGGWQAINTKTGQGIYVKTAARLRRLATQYEVWHRIMYNAVGC